MTYERGHLYAHLAYTDEGYLDDNLEKFGDPEKIMLPSEMIKEVAKGNATCAFFGSLTKSKTPLIVGRLKAGEVKVHVNLKNM